MPCRAILAPRSRKANQYASVTAKAILRMRGAISVSWPWEASAVTASRSSTYTRELLPLVRKLFHAVKRRVSLPNQQLAGSNSRGVRVVLLEDARGMRSASGAARGPGTGQLTLPAQLADHDGRLQLAGATGMPVVAFASNIPFAGSECALSPFAVCLDAASAVALVTGFDQVDTCPPVNGQARSRGRLNDEEYELFRLLVDAKSHSLSRDVDSEALRMLLRKLLAIDVDVDHAHDDEVDVEETNLVLAVADVVEKEISAGADHGIRDRDHMRLTS